MKRAVQPANKAFSSSNSPQSEIVAACGRHRPIAGPKSMQAWIGEAAGVAGVEQVSCGLCSSYDPNQEFIPVAM
jgi:hypothetical protein